MPVLLGAWPEGKGVAYRVEGVERPRFSSGWVSRQPCDLGNISELQIPSF